MPSGRGPGAPPHVHTMQPHGQPWPMAMHQQAQALFQQGASSREHWKPLARTTEVSKQRPPKSLTLAPASTSTFPFFFPLPRPARPKRPRRSPRHLLSTAALPTLCEGTSSQASSQFEQHTRAPIRTRDRTALPNAVVGSCPLLGPDRGDRASRANTRTLGG